MKKLTVKDILAVMDDKQEVNCHFTAYGITYANSWDDGLKTVAECKDGMNYDCINALVTGIRHTETFDHQHQMVQINATLTK